jgi:hypothetical protein
MNRIWWDITSITAVGYLARRRLARLFLLRWERTRRVWISGTRQRSSTTSLRPLIRTGMSRARATSRSSDLSDLHRHHRLRETFASILQNNPCRRLSLLPASRLLRLHERHFDQNGALSCAVSLQATTSSTAFSPLPDCLAIHTRAGFHRHHAFSAQ